MTTPDRPLRVGVVAAGLEERESDGVVGIGNGGVGVYIYQLVTHLRGLDDGNEYTLIRLGRGELDIYRQGPALFLPASPIGRVLAQLDLSYARIAAARQLDLLHFPNQFGGAFLPRRVRRVVTLHDLTPLLYPCHHPWRRVLGYRCLLRPALRAADHIIVGAESVAADLTARRLAVPDKVTVVPHGVDRRFRPGVGRADLARRYDLPERFVLTVGILEPRKNHALLVRALERLHRAGERLGLAIVGRDGWRWRDPLADPALAAMRPWVRICRNVSEPDLVALYQRAEVFAYPSFYEGFGLPILEAMACGTPVVASNTSAIPEVAGGAALLADPYDADDFAAKLLAVVRDDALRRRLRTAGCARAASFTWQQTATQTRAVYRRACGLSPGLEETAARAAAGGADGRAAVELASC